MSNAAQCDTCKTIANLDHAEGWFELADMHTARSLGTYCSHDCLVLAVVDPNKANQR